MAYEAIVQKLRSKADREFMMDFHNGSMRHIVQMEAMLEHVAEPEPKRVQLPRRLRRRSR